MQLQTRNDAKKKESSVEDWIPHRDRRDDENNTTQEKHKN